jgi:hypothetical protein
MGGTHVMGISRSEPILSCRSPQYRKPIRKQYVPKEGGAGVPYCNFVSFVVKAFSLT